mmetsp:Transcript_16631/g.49708  ORF Transcript_16631/g.49708 Transcript_16631/m.49708 type:complete len:130 (-) Transcript_16631:853-1242(-)
MPGCAQRQHQWARGALWGRQPTFPACTAASCTALVSTALDGPQRWSLTQGVLQASSIVLLLLLPLMVFLLVLLQQHGLPRQTGAHLHPEPYSAACWQEGEGERLRRCAQQGRRPVTSIRAPIQQLGWQC